MRMTSHPILSMVIGRIGLGLLSLLIVSLVIFFSVELLPGSYASAILGQTATPEAVAAMEEKLGLNQPAVLRYLAWLGGAATGDLGMSFAGRPVMTVLGPRLMNTVSLAAITALIAVPLAIMLGILCARFRGRFIDRFLSTSTLASISVPEFFVAYVVMMVLAVKLQWFPSMAGIRNSMDFGEQLYRMVLPILTLLLVILAHMVRNTRAAILSVMASPYVEMARLKGEPEGRVVMRQALPNAIGPIASVVALNLAYLISGVVVIEVVFVYPGVGQAMIDAVRNRDVPVIQACALIFATAYIGFNLIADIISIVSNPRLLHPR
ncbi:ABC transporter permease [Rhodobacter sp. SGA-6-6]|uniref:ABC transporter permease n=1 Tax=Rhodobacter sp. SGA-6-6 TaxID=2710882 RepID=UPI0013EA5B9C|nr:ABC transporter permease [Rhodobacter sp. SGA-6-6]NGM46038.1 ABC transporter permease [Rhodobacter sp. SGA-6-6]